MKGCSQPFSLPAVLCTLNCWHFVRCFFEHLLGWLLVAKVMTLLSCCFGDQEFDITAMDEVVLLSSGVPGWPLDFEDSIL